MTHKLYIITENVPDHEGYNGQVVIMTDKHKDDYFTVSDNNGGEWHCGAEELTEIKPELMYKALQPFLKMAKECLYNSNLHKDQVVYAYNNASITMQNLRDVEAALT